MPTKLRRTSLLEAFIKLAERAIHFTELSKLQSDTAWGEKLFRRSVHCQLGAFRLQRIAMEGGR